MGSVRFSLIAFSEGAFLLWLLVLGHVVGQVDAQRRREEVMALASFKNGLETSEETFDLETGNSIAKYWFTWNEDDENACDWYGVTCTRNYTVEELSLAAWGIVSVSSFAPLSKLPDLLQLDMSYNDLAGPIPDDVGSLTQLSYLDLSFNDFSGSIPSNISACRRLQSLNLGANALNGTIPDLSDLAHLQELLLAGNGLFGAFPSEIGEISSLLAIDMSFNQLNGRIPSLLNSTNLAILLLDNNVIAGFQDSMYINAPNLQVLDVSANSLHGPIPLALADLPNLVSLDLSLNNLSGTIPSGMFYQTNVSFLLDLSFNQLSGSVPGHLLQIPYYDTSASTIVLSHNRLDGSIPTTKGNGSGQLSVDLSYNQLSGAVPVSLVSLSVDLSLDYNLLSGDILDVLITAGQSNLNSFASLGNNFFTGDLSRIAFQWTNWTYLSYIDLSNNNLSWRVSESIPDPVSAVLFSLPIGLANLNLSGNNFSGTSLPIAPSFQATGYQNASSLKVLDLSNCQLEGVISGDIFNSMWMPYLQSLNLSHNSVTGPVPENITQLPSLQILDLSYNKLSGPLPRITGNSFLVNTSFFVGNEGLCGYPLDDCPSLPPSHGTIVQWWALLIIICGSVLISVASCLMLTWRWRVYRKQHEQDADLIQTLMERELVTLMPMRNLKKATKNFADSAQIAEGGFGKVYMGKLNDGTQVAIKRSKREGSEKDKEHFLNEVRILSQVNHRHLVKLLGCCMENKVALLVFEFISNGTLQDHLCGRVGDGHLSWKHRLDIATQTADALNYLHSSTNFQIYHRDVKTANILLNDDLSAKVADFGISKLAPTRATHVSTALHGTIGYMDPEYWVSFQLTHKSDVYSFGVVLLELISAKSPIDYQRGEEEASLVKFAGPYIQSENLQPLIDPTLLGTYGEENGHGKKSILDVGQLAMRCLHLHSSSRPSMNEVWKELQDLCLKFNGTLLEEEGLGCLNNDDSESPILDHEILLSSFNSTNRSDSLKLVDDGTLELAYFSHVSSCRES